MILGSGTALQSSPVSAEETAPAPASSPETTQASGSWQKHQYNFQYLGFTTTYSCDGLAGKLGLLLRAAGARADSKSRPDGCVVPYGRPDKFARANLTFYTLAPLADGAGAGEKPVAAQWRPVYFAPYSPHDLGRGDCELVELFRAWVLPMFTTRNVVDNTGCIPHQVSGTIIDLRFEVLAPVPRPGAPKTH
jgi:hypothetical protein